MFEDFGYLLALHRETARRSEFIRERLNSVLAFAALTKNLGEHHLAMCLLDDVLRKHSDPKLLAARLMQLLSATRSLGATEVAFV